MSVLLSRRAVIQAAVESTYNTPVAVGANDGILIMNPKFSVKTNVLERSFVKNDLSQNAIIMGRKIASMEFEVELRGNGRQNSGVVSDAPVLSRLIQACGYSLTGKSAASVKGVYPVGAQNNPVSWTSSGTVTATDVIAYYVTVDTAGVSGTCKVTVTSDTVGEGNASQSLTSGTPLSVGTKGVSITPTFTGSLVVGQRWIVWALPPGQSLNPISTGQQSLTLVAHMDGVLHQMPGSYGTFEITAQAGAFATIKFTFTGTYVAPTDDPNPTPNFETTLPSQVQLARLRADNFNAIVEKFTFTQGNDIQIRPDVSSSDGYVGVRIVARKTVGGIDPEADNVANYDFWGRLAAATQMPFQMRVGTVAGNTVWCFAPNVQYTGLTYKDRNGILAYDAGLTFGRVVGDDEFQLHLC